MEKISWIRRSLFYVAATAVTALLGCDRAQTKLQNVPSVNTFKKLLRQKNYFRLESEFLRYGSKLGEEDRLYLKSFVDNKFNRNEDCIKDIDSLLNKYNNKIPDSGKFILYQLQSESYFKIFQYKKAALSDGVAVKLYGKSVSKAIADGASNDLVRLNALKDVPPQQTIIQNATTIAWQKDKIGLIEIPVNINSQLINGIFDTRANISSITLTYARKLGLRLLNTSYDETAGVTGIKFKTALGVAESLRVGKIVIKNIVFQIIPDEMFYIASVKFQLNMIIGLPVIAQLQEVQFFRNGKMVIPLNPTRNTLHNMALDGLDPVIEITKDLDTLPFYFDSGAVTSILYTTYFEKYKKTVLDSGIKKKVEIGGAGGSQKKDIFVLPVMRARLAGQPMKIDSVTVLTQKTAPDERFYGNLGLDFMLNYNEIVLSFKYMYLRSFR